jgi:hypothetical protein
MMYSAKFQSLQGYWESIQNASFDEAIKFLDQQIKIHTNYLQASIFEQNGMTEIFSYRTVK